MHFIHLEDCESDAELIHASLRDRWPELEITTLHSREAFESAVQRNDYDLILSDYSLPGYNGLSALDFARSHQVEKPFIYISGTIGEERAIQALKAGATDYVIKDRPARLIPAIEAALIQTEQEIDRRRAEERIHEQASLLDKAREAICVTDSGGQITFWNASAEKLYGWSADEAIGRSLRELLYAEDQSRFDAASAQVRAVEDWQGELRPTPRGGGEVIIESHWCLVANHGKVRSILIIDTDVTEKRKLEGQLREAQRLETLGMLAGGIAHDLNNVLAPILTSVGVLRERAAQPLDRDMLETVGTSAQHGADLVRQLLAFARGKSEKRDEVSVDSLVGSVRRLLQPAMPPSVELRVALAGELWPVHADATQLRQVLLNLCINARDAMAEGGRIEIQARNVEVDPSTPCLQGQPGCGAHVRLSVADNGSGIPPEIQAKIFDPFFTTKKAGKGTGLGLVNVAKIVEAHGGFLGLETQPGKGTTFHVYLPALTRPTAEAVSRVADARQPVHGAGEHILVIEDDEGIRTVLEIILSTRGYRVTLASCGEDGLAELQARPGEFALVLTDMNMPGMSGGEVVQAIRALPGAPQKVAVVSGLGPDHHELPAALAGTVFLHKPLTTDGLLAAVRGILDGPPAEV